MKGHNGHFGDLIAVITTRLYTSPRDSTVPVIECDVDAARGELVAAGVSVEPGNTDHERWRATRGDAVAVAYDDKVVVQGATPTDITALLEDASGEATVYFDGACRGNPGPAAIGWVLASDGRVLEEGGETIGDATNNRAEYEALDRALSVAQDHGFDRITARGDSELIVKQVRGEYDVNDPQLRERRVSVMERLACFDEWDLEHVPRELNDRADELANRALDDA
jgi:ribonuclease HI